MVNQKFIADTQHLKTLHTLKDKHCMASNNRTNELLSFVSAARSLAVDPYFLENYIINNISIAENSTKAKPKALKKLIEDSYSRYPVGNHVGTGSNTAKVTPVKNMADYKAKDPKAILTNYNTYRISTHTNYPIPDPIISIKGESIATAGNIMSVSGLQKSGKSSLCNIILAGSLSDAVDGIPPDLKVNLSGGKAVIHIDTEQAKHRQQSNIKYSIVKRAGVSDLPDHFYSYNIRGMETQPAVTMLNEIFHAANETHGGIHFALIDGIADFITSVNDEEQSNNIVKQLEHLATVYNTLIIVVIHRNPNDNKVRGHLGSQLIHKSESVLAVKKDGDSSYIDPEYLRTAANGDIPKYLFKYNKDKGYHCYTGELKTEVKETREEQLHRIAESLVAGKEYPRQELLTIVSDNMGVGVDMAQKVVKQFADEEYISPTGKKGIWAKNIQLPFDDEGAVAA